MFVKLGDVRVHYRPLFTRSSTNMPVDWYGGRQLTINWGIAERIIRYEDQTVQERIMEMVNENVDPEGPEDDSPMPRPLANIGIPDTFLHDQLGTRIHYSLIADRPEVVKPHLKRLQTRPYNPRFPSRLSRLPEQENALFPKTEKIGPTFDFVVHYMLRSAEGGVVQEAVDIKYYEGTPFTMGDVKNMVQRRHVEDWTRGWDMFMNGPNPTPPGATLVLSPDAVRGF